MYPWPIVPPSCGIVESFKTLFFVFFLKGGGGWGRGSLYFCYMSFLGGFNLGIGGPHKLRERILMRTSYKINLLFSHIYE